MTNELAFAGADISCDWIDVCLRKPHREKAEHRRFDNPPDRIHRSQGEGALLRWLGGTGRTGRTRIAVEATGPYSLELTLTLHQAEAVEPRPLK